MGLFAFFVLGGFGGAFWKAEGCFCCISFPLFFTEESVDAYPWELRGRWITWLFWFRAIYFFGFLFSNSLDISI